MFSDAFKRTLQRVRAGGVDRAVRAKKALVARPIWWSAWITTGFASLLFLLLTPTFNSNDDISMMFIANGSWFGEPQAHLVFTNPIIGQAVASLYGWIPAIPWYPVYLFALSCITLFVLVWLVLTDRREHFGWRLLSLSAVVAVFETWLWMNVQFTSVAIALGGAGVVLYAAMAGSERIPVWVIAGAGTMIGVASLVRWRSFQAVVILAIPIIVLMVRAIPWKRQAWFAGAALAVVVLGIAFQSIYYAGDDEWNDFFAFNEVRGTLHNSTRLNVAAGDPDVLTAVGWSRNDLNMFKRFFYVDNDVYNTDTLTTFREQTGAPTRSPLKVFGMASGLEGITRMALLVALGFWGWVRGRRKGRLVIPVVILWFAFVAVGLVVFARLPYRVAVPLLAMLAFFLMIRPKPVVGDDRDMPNPHWMEATARMLLAATAIGGIGIGLAVTINASGHNDAVNNRFFEVTDELGEFDPEGVFVSVAGSVGTSAVSPEAGRGIGATIVPLGWHQQSPMFDERLSDLGIDDLYLSIANDPGTYVVLNRNAAELDYIPRYLDEHYGLSGHLRPSARVGSLVVFDSLAEYSINANGALREDIAGETVRFRLIGEEGAAGAWDVADNGRSIEGWVIDTNRYRPADRIVVFAGATVTDLQVPFSRRRAISDEYGLERSAPIGFTAGIEQAHLDDVRVFAVVGTRVFEVPRTGG
ncbi:DUF2029 domain-containing protein [bacterium]|nr:DUF2029 domain-containing protein [bacterium]